MSDGGEKYKEWPDWVGKTPLSVECSGRSRSWRFRRQPMEGGFVLVGCFGNLIGSKGQGEGRIVGRAQDRVLNSEDPWVFGPHGLAQEF